MGSLQFLLLFLGLRPLRSFNIDTSKRWASPIMSPPFGHRVLQHSDGERNWILVTSLGFGDSGTLYKCEMQDELRCEVVSLGENIQKLRKLQAGIALAQSPEQILVCLQQKRRQRRRVTQELNGICILLSSDFREKAFFNLTNIIESMSSNRVQRHKRSSENVKGFDHIESNGVDSTVATLCHNPEGSPPCRDPIDGSFLFGEKGRNANNNNNNYMEQEAEEEEEESDLRTEIAIILDGSGSIEPEDFERAKDFIYNMMTAFYEKCYECVFALVQYGYIIQTEFDFREGRNALKKIQAITQVRNVTRTASAIQHVLDSIFNTSYGSQKNTAKIMVVLTDGEIFMDPLNLTTVINSEQMAGIERYAIGVGEAFNKTKALQELRMIASDPDEKHLFRVTNYSALNVLLSTMQQKIIGLEGTAGDILEFELAQSGFSVHLLDEVNNSIPVGARYILFGAVGAFDWTGGVLLYDKMTEAAVFLNKSTEETTVGGKNGYLGYSVDAVHTRHGPWIVTGAPRYNMVGRVLMFEGGLVNQSLQGEQIGSYFGSELCPLDLDGDGLTDYLLVGAPFFHVHGEEGKVYLYRLDQEKNHFDLAGHLNGQAGISFARFGFAITGIGDVNQDGFGDVAIGAPLEEQESSPNSFGSIYIFNGKKDGLQSAFSQRITATQVGLPGLFYFGRSVAGGLDFTADGLPDVAVGSLGRVVLLRSRLVIRLEPTMDFTPGEISNFYNSSVVTARLCFQKKSPPGDRQPGMGHLFIHYTMDLDIEMERKRAQFEDDTSTTSGEVFYAADSCPELKLIVLPCQEDCFSSITLRLIYRLQDSNDDPGYPSPGLDVYQESEMNFQLPYVDDCEDKTDCAPHLSLTVQTEKELVVGSTKELAMRIYLENTGDNSHMTSLVLEFPTNLHVSQVQEVSPSLVDCDDSKALSHLTSSLSCKIGHPIFKKSAANFSITWQPDGKKFPDNSTHIILSVTNANKNSTALRKEVFLNVKYALGTILSRPFPVIYVVSPGGSSQKTNFTFNIQGRNQFGAQLELQIWVPVMLEGQLLASVKDVRGTQNSTVCKAKNILSEKPWTDFRHGDSKTESGVEYQLVSCVILLEREVVTVTAELPLANSLQFLKTRTDFVVHGELSFNKNLFVGLNAETHKAEIWVILLKEDVFNYLPVIIGSSVGGVVLLLLITIILYKCGFFKRNYQYMKEYDMIPEKNEVEQDFKME